MSYVAAQLLGGHIRKRTRGHAALLSACFVLGFSLVFVALGVFLLRYRYEAGIAGGAVIALFGVGVFCSPARSCASSRGGCAACDASARRCRHSPGSS